MQQSPRHRVAINATVPFSAPSRAEVARSLRSGWSPVHERVEGRLQSGDHLLDLVVGHDQGR